MLAELASGAGASVVGAMCRWFVVAAVVVLVVLVAVDVVAMIGCAVQLLARVGDMSLLARLVEGVASATTITTW